MDVTALLVFVGGFAVCAALVFMVSFFGVKEQTFEEALAAQRKKNEKEKNKAKDKKKDGTKKKNQKWNKKKENEDRAIEPNVGDLPEEEPVLVESLEEVPLLEETPTQLLEDSTPEVSPQPTPEPKETKPVRKEKKKPKIEIQDIAEEVVEKVLFEPIIEEDVVIEPVTLELVEEAVVEPQETLESLKSEPATEKMSTASREDTMTTPAWKRPKASPVIAKKSGKKQQSQTAAKHGSKDLLSIVEKAVLNDFEAQQIIDVLLNKQSGNISTGAEEWVEQGKPSETAKLQKQIAELEKAIEEEVSKGKSFKDKMTELRRELNEEKSGRAAATRMIEEINNSRTQETNNLNNKLQQVQYDMTQQLTIIQTQLNQQVQHNHQMELDQTHYLATIESLNQQLKKANETTINASASAANDQHILSELEQLRGLRNKYEVSLKEYATKNTSLQEQLTAKTEEALQCSAYSAKLANRLTKLCEKLERQEAEGQADDKINLDKGEKSKLMAMEVMVMAMEKKKLAMVTEEVAAMEKKKLAMMQEELAAECEQYTSTSAAPNKDVKAIEELTLRVKAFEMEIVDKQSTIDSLKSKNDELSSLAKTYDREVKAIITRLFPNLDGSASADQLEAAAKKQIEALSDPGPSAEVEKLESQVSHYKMVLAQTESMLTSLQSSVEAEEGEWRGKLDAANRDVSYLKMEISSLQVKNSSLEESMVLVKQAEEMQAKLIELQSKLTCAEEENGNLHKDVECLWKELSEEKNEHNQIKTAQEELISKNTQLSQLLATGQQALEKETSAVKSMQEQLAKSRNNSGSDSIEELEIPTQKEMAAEVEDKVTEEVTKMMLTGPSKLFLTIHKAELAKKGTFGKADPYVVIKLGEQSFKTKVIDNDQTPEWNHRDWLIIDQYSPKSFRLEILDDDIGKDDTLGYADVNIQDLIKAKKMWIPLENCKSGQVLISTQVKDDSD